MTISEDKHRFVVILDKEIFIKFKVLAAKENRSASNLAAKMITDYVTKNQKQD